MMTPEKTFVLRFTIQAELRDDDDEDHHLHEWEREIKPALIKAAFESLRTHRQWEAFVRNRGIAPEDEVEVVVTRKA
ncbi:MAG: hypothetical protein U1E76_27810 [Planctomycetota bacterium]